MPFSEKTVLLRECNSDIFSVGYSNQENDSYFNFLQTGICVLFSDALGKNSIPGATTLLREMYVPKFWFHVMGISENSYGHALLQKSVTPSYENSVPRTYTSPKKLWICAPGD